MQDQFDIGGIFQDGAAPGGKLFDEVGPAVDAGVGGDPHLAVQAAGLPLASDSKVVRSRVWPRPTGAINPDPVVVGAAESQEFGQAPQQLPDPPAARPD